MNTYIEIKELPLKAQNELIDFYEFLRQKYAPKLQRRKRKSIPKNSFIHEAMNNPTLTADFKPFSREAIYETR